MALGLERLLLIIDADAKGAISGINATGAAADASLTPIEARAATGAAGTLALGAAGVVAGALIVGGLSKADDAYVGLGNQARQVSRLTGDSTKDASDLVYIAARSGVSFDALNTGITRVSKNSAKLSDIGVSLTDNTGKARPFVSVLGDIADYFQTAPAGIDKTAEAVNLFGRGGTAMLPILNRGSAGIKELAAEAKAMGLELGTNDYDQIIKHVTAQRQLQQSVKAVEVEFGRAVDPAYTAAIKAVGDVVSATAKEIHDHPLATEVIAGTAGVVGVAAGLAGAVALVGLGVGKAADGFKVWGSVLGAAKAKILDTTEATDALTESNGALAASADLAKSAEATVGTDAAVQTAYIPSARIDDKAAALEIEGANSFRSRTASSADEASEGVLATAHSDSAAAMVAERTAADDLAASLALDTSATDAATTANLALAASADKVALSEANAGAASEESAASKGAGLGGIGVGGAATIAIAAEVGSQADSFIGDKIFNPEGAQTKASAELQAATSGKALVRAFVDSAGAEAKKAAANESIFDLLKGAVGIEKPLPTVDLSKTFTSVLSQSTDKAQEIVDAYKQQDQALDHTGSRYQANEAQVRKWQKAIDDAKSSQDALTGSTKQGTVAVDAFGLEVVKGKSPLDSFATSLASESATFGNVINAETGVQSANLGVTQAQQKVTDDETGGTGDTPQQQAQAVASASDQVASSQRSEQEATRTLTQANRDLATAREAASRAPGDQTKADAVSSAEDRVKAAQDGVASSSDAAASASRDFADAQANQIDKANALADANDKVSDSLRSQAEAQRGLVASQRTLSEDQKALSRINPQHDPVRFQAAQDKVLQDQDSVANARDSVAGANEQSAAAVRDRTQTAADQKAQAADTTANDKLALTQAQNAATTAAIGLVVAEAQLADLVKASPTALPGLLAQVQHLADTGIIPQSTATEFENQLKFAAAAAGNMAGAFTAATVLFQAQKNAQGGVAGKLGGGGGFAGLGPPASPSSSTSGGGAGNKADTTYDPAAGGKAPAKSVKAEPKTIQAGPVIGSTIVEGSDKHWYYVNPANPSHLLSRVPGYVDGGQIPGSGNQDTHLAYLTPGEFVVTKAAVQRVGTPYLDSLNQGTTPAYANGGLVYEGDSTYQKATSVFTQVDASKKADLSSPLAPPYEASYPAPSYLGAPAPSQSQSSNSDASAEAILTAIRAGVADAIKQSRGINQVFNGVTTPQQTMRAAAKGLAAVGHLTST